MIFVISGLSGSGKSTISKIISEKTNIPTVIQHTTRPIRPGEINGVDYNFVDNKEFDSLNMIVKEEFKVANGEIWKYGLLDDKNLENYITVLPPRSIKYLKDKNDYVFDILVEVDDEIRIDRIYNRNDNQSLEEIKRRDLDDKNIFKDYKPCLIVSNDDNVEDTAKDIINIINGLFTL